VNQEMAAEATQVLGDPEATQYLGDSSATVAAAPEPNLRAEFGAHLEANYPGLVAQLCMITLNATEAQDLVQEAYSRAWQRWSDIRELPNPTGWVRYMAVQGSNRRWRRFLSKLGIDRYGGKNATPPSDDPAHQAVLSALGQMPQYRRRVLVLADVAQVSIADIAELENLDIGVAEARLAYAQRELTEIMSQGPSTVPPTANWEDM
jgi:RNA polymerase sigma-70 factor (ECF subfamily)